MLIKTILLFSVKLLFRRRLLKRKSPAMQFWARAKISTNKLLVSLNSISMIFIRIRIHFATIYANRINKYLTVMETVIFYVKMKYVKEDIFYYPSLTSIYITVYDSFISSRPILFYRYKKIYVSKNIFIVFPIFFSMSISSYRYKNEYFENYFREN